MLTLLLFLAPKEAWALLIVIGGLLIIIGFRKAGLVIIGTICLLALFAPFFDNLFDSLPPGIIALLMVIFIFWLFRTLFGRRVSGNILSAMILGLLKAPFRFLGWLFRMPVRRP